MWRVRVHACICMRDVCAHTCTPVRVPSVNTQQQWELRSDTGGTQEPRCLLWRPHGPEVTGRPQWPFLPGGAWRVVPAPPFPNREARVEAEVAAASAGLQ